MAGEIYPMVEITDYPERFVPKGEEAESVARQGAFAHPRKSSCHRTQRQRAVVPAARNSRLVDIYVVMFTRWRGTVGRDWLEGGHIPKLHAIAEKLSKRERIAPVWQRHFAKD